MQVDSPEAIRNVAVTGHSGTGKTTLISALLYASGVTNRLNRVEDGNTTTDFDSEEIARGISINLGACFAPWNKNKVNLLDCPGYGIFFNETKAAMRAADSVLLCVNGVAGLEVTGEKAWKFAEELEQPVAIHLTMMDRERASLDDRLKELQERLGREVVALQVPIGSEGSFEGVVDLLSGKALLFDRDGNGKAKQADVPDDLKDRVEELRTALVETIAESNMELLERFLEEGDLSSEELLPGMRRAILKRRLFPVTVSSSLHGIGPSALLDSIVDILPAPSDRESFPASSLGGDPIELESSVEGEAACLAFKTLNDPFTGKLTLLRVVSGTLGGDTMLWNPRTESKHKLGALLQLQGKQGAATPKAVAGDVVAVAKLKNVHTGDTLCSEQRVVKIDWIPVDDPAMSFAIEPKAKGDEEKIGDALGRLTEEDTGLRAGRDPETGEFLLSGAGQLHAEIAVARLKERSNVEIILHPPKVPYRETIKKPAPGHGRHKKQSGGRGQFADCKIQIEPLPRGGDFEFVDEIFGGSIPQQYRPAVEKGIQEARARGFLAGNPVVDFKVRLLDGQFHDVDSSEIAFKIAGSLAFREAMAGAAATILEPIMSVEVETSEEFMGDIMGDLSQRRGRPQGMESRDGNQFVSALVPMSEMLTYARALNSMTQGRSSFHMEFSHYDELPKQLQQTLIEEYESQKAQES